MQYKTSGILRYERVFGEGYVSTGGIGEPTNRLGLLLTRQLFTIYKNQQYTCFMNRDYKGICGHAGS